MSANGNAPAVGSYEGVKELSYTDKSNVAKPPRQIKYLAGLQKPPTGRSIAQMNEQLEALRLDPAFRGIGSAGLRYAISEAVRAWADGEGVWWVSRARWAEHIGVSVRSVQRAVNEGAKAGIFEAERQAWESNKRFTNNRYQLSPRLRGTICPNAECQSDTRPSAKLALLSSTSIKQDNVNTKTPTGGVSSDSTNHQPKNESGEDEGGGDSPPTSTSSVSEGSGVSASSSDGRAQCPHCEVTERGPRLLAEHIYNAHDGPLPAHWAAADARVAS